MFSITTIASSTTNPVEIVSAISDKLSRLYPHRYMIANVPISDTGTATLGISVARQFRKNTNTTKMTRITDKISDRSTSFTDARIVVVRSSTISESMPCGIVALMYGSASRMRFTVAMMFAPGCREIMIGIDRFPFKYPAARMFCTESVTSATSASRTAAPLL